MGKMLAGFQKQNGYCAYPRRITYYYMNDTVCPHNVSDGCIICRKITNKDNVEKFQKYLDTLEGVKVENGMKKFPDKCNAIRFTTAGAKNPLGYSFDDQKIPDASSSKYLGIILRSDLNWVNQVN
jgi:hypothetical protein